MVRVIGGLMVGVLVAVAAIFCVEIVGHQLYPLREVDLRDSEAVAALIAGLPLGALLFVAAAWVAGALFGGLAAAIVAARVWAAWAIGVLVAVAAIANVLMYPHPEWMQVAALIAPAIGALIAGHIARRRLSPMPLASAA